MDMGLGLGLGALADFLGSLTASSPTAGSSINLTKGGASEFMKELQPYLMRMMMGGEAPDIGLLKQYFEKSFQNLGQAQTSALGTAAGGAGAYAASKGLNPYAYLQHAQAGVYDKYTPQFGELAANQSKQLFGANRDMLSQLLNLRGQMVGYGGNLSPTSNRGSEFGSGSQMINDAMGMNFGMYSNPAYIFQQEKNRRGY